MGYSLLSVLVFLVTYAGAKIRFWEITTANLSAQLTLGSLQCYLWGSVKPFVHAVSPVYTQGSRRDKLCMSTIPLNLSIMGLRGHSSEDLTDQNGSCFIAGPLCQHRPSSFFNRGSPIVTQIWCWGDWINRVKWAGISVHLACGPLWQLCESVSVCGYKI